MFCLPSSAIWKTLFELLEERMPFMYYSMSHVSSMLLRSAKPQPSGLKKLRYNPLCDADEESNSEMLSEELNIDSDDEINLEIEGDTASEELSIKMSMRVRVKQMLLMLMGGKTRQWVTRNPTHTHLLKMQGHNLTFCQMQSPWIILFFNYELLNTLL
jgi:hypothetical protein